MKRIVFTAALMHLVTLAAPAAGQVRDGELPRCSVDANNEVSYRFEIPGSVYRPAVGPALGAIATRHAQSGMVYWIPFRDFWAATGLGAIFVNGYPYRNCPCADSVRFTKASETGNVAQFDWRATGPAPAPINTPPGAPVKSQLTLGAMLQGRAVISGASIAFFFDDNSATLRVTPDNYDGTGQPKQVFNARIGCIRSSPSLGVVRAMNAPAGTMPLLIQPVR